MGSTGKGVTNIIIVGLKLILLVFTASRTLDLFQSVLPASQGIYAYFGLAAIDGGVIGWSYFYSHGARGFQRSIAFIMAIVSLLAVGITTVGDLLINASSKGIINQVDETTRLALLVAIGVVIVGNIAAGFMVNITEPERAKAIAMEDAHAAIHAETLRQIHAATPQVAAQVAPELTKDWVRQTAHTLVPGKTIYLAGSTDVDATPSQNGHKPRGSLQQSSN